MELPDSPSKRTGAYDEVEKDFIKKNYASKTDKEIADMLGRPITGIARIRKELGLIKEIGRPQKDSAPMPKIVDADEEYNYANLDKTKRKQLAKRVFLNSPDYKRFAEQFTPKEMDVYAERFSDYLAEWQQILPQEKEQLHTVIKETILQDRFLKSIRHNEELKDKMNVLNKQRLDIIMKPKKTNDDLSQLEQIKEAIREVQTTLDPTEYIWKNYNESSTRSKDALKALRMTREQRLKFDQERGLSIVTIVQSLNSQELRKKAGEEVALTARLTEEYKDKFKKDGFMFGEL